MRPESHTVPPSHPNPRSHLVVLRSSLKSRKAFFHIVESFCRSVVCVSYWEPGHDCVKSESLRELVSSMIRGKAEKLPSRDSWDPGEAQYLNDQAVEYFYIQKRRAAEIKTCRNWLVVRVRIGEPIASEKAVAEKATDLYLRSTHWASNSSQPMCTQKQTYFESQNYCGFLEMQERA